MTRTWLLALLITLGFSQASLHAQPAHTVSFETSAELQAYLKWRPQRLPLIGAHRGGPSPGFPENCIETFERSMQFAPCLIECDVRKSKDGVLVLMHDRSVDRTTTGKGLVERLSLVQLKQLHLTDAQGTVTRYKIPTLADALGWTQGRAIIELDIKGSVTPLEVVQAIKTENAESCTIVITYDVPTAEQYHRLNDRLVLSCSARGTEGVTRLLQGAIPAANLIAFVGTYEPPREVYASLHEEGVCAILGTMGNLDARARRRGIDVYGDLLRNGADILATDEVELASEAITAYLRNPTPPRADDSEQRRDPDSATRIDPSDPNFLYTGRWQRATPSAPWCSWQGSSIIANFRGTSVSARLEAVAGGKDWVFVIIDDDLTQARSIALAGGAHDYLLASGLPDTLHKVEIVKKSNAGRDRVLTFHGFNSSGQGLASPPARSRLKLEFYGDSNLAGNSVEHEKNRGDMRYRDSYYGLAGIASRMLDAEYHNISKSGESVRNVMKNIWDKYYPNSSELWDFSQHRPDAVIVNIGANDVGRRQESIVADYDDFLDALRETHPEAHIVVMNAYGWSYDEPANFTEEDVVAVRNDANMSFLRFPWVFEQWHGCQYDHAGMATLLAEHLSERMGWDSQPSDVMSGFGREGDVANGGFEEVAPFGGYGWRYAAAKGVSRITGAVDAHDGDCYLRLENGANVHQPNPASEGEGFTVSVWARGGAKGAQGKITIEFKDQKMWTDPLDSHSAILTLTTDWQEYSVTRTAPTGGSKSVYQIKVILQAGQGDLVDFDSVRMKRNQG